MTWISFTGIDGVGKTTLVKHASELLKKNHSVKTFKSPYFDWVREMLIISGDGKPLGDVHTDTAIFVAGLRLEMYLIKRWTQEHGHLISQRSWLDFFPYNSTKGISIEESLHFLQPEGFLMPDVLFFLDCDVPTALARIADDPKKDKYEENEFMQRLRPNFREFISRLEKNELPPPLNHVKIHHLDAHKTLSVLRQEVEDILHKEQLI